MGCFKTCKKRNTVIDYIVFRLHYKVTGPLLVILCAVLASLHYTRSPIDCIPVDNVPHDYLNSYCYSQYGKENTDLSLVEAGLIDERMDFPEDTKPGKPRTWTNDPRIVLFLLSLQFVFCLLPRFFWSKMESGRMSELVELLENPEQLMDAIFANKNKNRIYFMWYSFAEASNAVFDFLYIFIMGSFFGRQYYDYGLQVVLWAVFGGTGSTPRIFPDETACTYRDQINLSGSIEYHVAICLLPMNSIYEKVFFVLWFWFALLCLLSCLAAFYRAATCVGLRTTKFSTHLVERGKLGTVLKQCTPGDRLLIHLLSQNISSVRFRDFISNAFDYLDKSDDSASC
ncbi:hypothetical protein JTE90_010195 [Oedothorax gibbosus]|uniref:Innexin n=1 Tax=Oedothorax gibbosus TaxID=931172 RepID=A0AAV6UKD9_9ARAC|nr:hypothetical protein JTE90_010195 [Oedothorax gibbosus]